MALVCTACGTENRSVAKFCIECIAALPVGFEATQLVPQPAPREAPVSDGMPSALAAFAAAPPPQPQAAVRSAAPPPPETRRTGLWVSVGALAIALVVGAAGWALAGAGSWYIYKEKVGNGVEEREPAAMLATPSAGEAPRAPTAAAAEAAAPPVTSVAAPAAPVPAAPLPAVASTLSPGEVLVADLTDAGRQAAPQAQRRPDTPLATAPARAAQRPHAAPAPAPATSSLAKACGGMNFIAAARCKVAECAKPALQATAECKVVLAQQRLMEEKRNPTLAN